MLRRRRAGEAHYLSRGKSSALPERSGDLHKNPIVKRFLDMNVLECSTPHSLRRLTSNEMSNRVHHIAVQDVASLHSGFTNLVSNVPLVSAP